MNTQEPVFDPEDPKLTAYALGELTDPAERAAVEQTLQSSPEARAVLREIRELTAALSAEYEQERRLADGAGAVLGVLPSNVVSMVPASRTGRAWSRRLLLAAAGLLLTASVARLMVVGGAGERRTAAVHATGATKPSPSVAMPAKVSPPVAAPATALALNVPLKADAPGGPILPLLRSKDEQAASASSSELKSVPAAQPAKEIPFPLALEAGSGQLALPAKATWQTDTALALQRHDASAPLEQSRVDALFAQSTDGEKKPSASIAVPAGPGQAVAATATVNAKPAIETRLDIALGTAMARRGDASPAVPNAASPAATGFVGGLPTAGGRAGGGGRLLAQVPKTAEADWVDSVVVTGSNTPTSEAVGIAPVDTAGQTLRDRTGQEDVLSQLPRAKSAAVRRKLKPVAPGFNTATYEHLVENAFLAAKDNPLSTFSIDVDTASYANVRRFIESGSLPPPDAVRIEELVNYFPYSYAPPAPGDEHPFAVHLEAASCPWNPQDRLVRIGIKGRELAQDKRPPSNLVFLLDVSGSMEPPERLPLIKASMRMLVEHLTENDRVAIVVYAGESGVALPSTKGDHKDDILRALENLHAGGSTNGASGIKLAYRVAREGFIKGGTNRVILATDGDFNVGVTSQGDLIRLIQSEAKSGVFLSALGVGTDNYKDATMQKLADKGNGNYAYIDRLEEARKVLVEQMSGTLVTIAKDVKIQVEFNPATVAAYRLIGYEKRMLRKEDFNDDRIDAGEIGAGHSITALYEVVPAGQTVPQAAPTVDALKYGNAPVRADAAAEPTPGDKRDPAPAATGELLTVKMRHKAPDGDKSERSYEESLTDHGAAGDFTNASPDFKFAAAVAGFGLVLRDSPHKGEATLGAAIELAQEGKGADLGGHRAGFIELVKHARAIQAERGGE